MATGVGEETDRHWFAERGADPEVLADASPSPAVRSNVNAGDHLL